MGIGDIPGSLRDLSKEQRHALANLLNARKSYAAEEIKLNDLRLRALANPTSENEKAVRDFASTVTTPLREDVTRQTLVLMHEAIDTKGLVEFLPSVLMGLLQFVNLPLMLTAIGVDPDEADKIIQIITDYVKKGM
ncbi:MAG TPA: hypothetical protein VJ841_01775 [Candidatus Saccharimonadales bacterium]|nr:hypothetical protein [Candidatus Saccharimonadales bacterium]